MRTNDIHKLVLALELWKGGATGSDQVAAVLGWTPGKASEIFLNIGLKTCDDQPNPGLTTDQLLIALLWYHVNVLIKQQQGGSHAENPNP